LAVQRGKKKQFNPVVKYDNADVEKVNIFAENHGKAGVYRWINKISGNTYVGSSIDLGNRLYTTSAESKKLNLSFVIGFIEAEGSFTIYMSKSYRYTLGWDTKSVFSIGLHPKDRLLLENISALLGVGKIYQMKDSVHLRVESLEGINKLIQILDNNLLISQKRADFELFKQAVERINRGEHLTIEGLRKIVAIRASMNLGLSEALKEAFPVVKPVDRPEVKLPSAIDCNWLAGFAEGESNFAIRVTSSATNKSGKSVSLTFTITQHKRDFLLMKSIFKLLDCGQVKARPKESCVDFIVTKFSDIDAKIIPFFKKYPLTGCKKLDYLDFCKAAELIKNKVHLTSEGLEEILRIKAGMNTGRKLGLS
jgi:hypothetical protein